MKNKKNFLPDKTFLPEQIFLSGQFLKEISIFDNIYIELSGGYHSTITAILFYELGYKNIGLIHNNTKRIIRVVVSNFCKSCSQVT